MPSLPSAIVRPLVAAAVVLASLATATQWTAALLAYHPALGVPWLDLLGLKLYAPWKVFSWWLACEKQDGVKGGHQIACPSTAKYLR